MASGDDLMFRHLLCSAVTEDTRVGLSRSEILLKTELMARTWQAHAAVCAALETFRPEDPADRVQIGVVRLEYLEALRSLGRFTAAVASRQWDALLRAPADWHSAPDADDVRFWIKAYVAFSSTLAKLPALRGLDYPPEDILTAFEELPDCP
jgi:hypothetical protein